MATKAQKRQIAADKRAEFDKDERERGLKAQQGEKDARARKERQAKAAAVRMNNDHKKLLAMHTAAPGA